jgi:two-component system KDP operon response regulator KdpE
MGRRGIQLRDFVLYCLAGSIRCLISLMSPANGNILVTDDDPELRRVLTRTLDALGFQVAESPNGEHALKAVDASQYDVVLMDVNMPGIGGIEACRAIRKKAPRLQIMMLTVRDLEAEKNCGFRRRR